ncbi:unnamed protein product [Leptosia nina]|uniref:Uncharacterized protein n=1 Tax=Leptosia nina TaxID=320188 RepID=A0AAV1J9J7_9NEOP
MLTNDRAESGPIGNEERGDEKLNVVNVFSKRLVCTHRPYVSARSAFEAILFSERAGVLPAAYCLRAGGAVALLSYYSIERLSAAPHDRY